ncbi:carboxymuconolactone decarboxylase family protein [Pedobacter hiemivivus]|uniref:Carboxymuconolactone decarboxylase family protein n=1 Tax=Pedobacter hiemivivus TaxID=2530454 RepID=A0A4U1GHG9_9SPHI|nr:carboxymuconolactone decarboxylase family protein [Pedobacter hiemivivus]TKC62390.1 carboxymuconolactone decarboxylase family protein [Pedobacter hiemivivus]
MARLKALNPEEATGKTKELFDSVNSKMGMIPNMMRTMGNSAAALNGYLGFNAALNNSSIGTKLGELISLTVANENGCNYCNSAHSYIGSKIGLEAAAINDARSGISADPKINAALGFAKAILDNRGHVSDTVIEDIKAAGYSDAEIVEIVAKVSLSIYTNYLNIVAGTDIDFPKLTPIQKLNH